MATSESTKDIHRTSSLVFQPEWDWIQMGRQLLRKTPKRQVGTIEDQDSQISKHDLQPNRNRCDRWQVDSSEYLHEDSTSGNKYFPLVYLIYAIWLSPVYLHSWSTEFPRLVLRWCINKWVAWNEGPLIFLLSSIAEKSTDNNLCIMESVSTI